MQFDTTSLGRPCIAPGNDLHTCTVCTLRFHHLCAGEDSGWAKCPACVFGSGAAPVQRAGPSSGAALAVVGDGLVAPAAAVSGGQRCGARKRKSGASGGASGVDDEDKGGCRRLRQDFPHAPVQQPAWL